MMRLLDLLEIEDQKIEEMEEKKGFVKFYRIEENDKEEEEK